MMNLISIQFIALNQLFKCSTVFMNSILLSTNIRFLNPVPKFKTFRPPIRKITLFLFSIPLCLLQPFVFLSCYVPWYHNSFTVFQHRPAIITLCQGACLVFLISSFRRVQNIVCFLLGNSPVSDLYMPTFRNTLSVPSS